MGSQQNSDYLLCHSPGSYYSRFFRSIRIFDVRDAKGRCRTWKKVANRGNAMKLTWAVPSVGRFLRYGKVESQVGRLAAVLCARTVVH